MRLECQLASHGVTDINDPRAKELSKERKRVAIAFAS